MKNILTSLLMLNSFFSIGQEMKIQSDELVKNTIWQLETDYWQYVRNQDLTAYAKLWDDQFIGYPSNNRITNKDHITDWIKDLYTDKNRTFTIELERKAENVFGDIVMVFYDVHYTWKNEKKEIVELVHSKITHTWRKSGTGWSIIGGMGANINTTIIK